MTSLPDSSSPPNVIQAPERVYNFMFHGTGSVLFSIFILNVLKTITTLGVYYFWGKIKTRQFVWGRMEAAGDRFGYHGTGLELLLGWLKAALLFGTIIATQVVLEFTGHPAIEAMVIWLGFACLVPLAQIGSARYRLSRSSWRGIRFSFRGSVKPFFLLSIRGMILSAVTLGVFVPFYECEARRYLMDHSKLGNVSFGFDGSPKKLLRIYVTHSIAGILGLVCLATVAFMGRDMLSAQEEQTAKAFGIVFFIPFILLYGLITVSLTARRRRFYWDHTYFGTARFKTTVTTGNLLRLYVVNFLLFIVTLGLASPWITVRSRQYDCTHLTLTGALDLDSIRQDVQTATATAEELGGFLDVDAMPG